MTSPKTVVVLLLILLGLFLLWCLWGWISVRNIEEPAYTLNEKQYSGLELRDYPALLLAQTTVNASGDEALNEGFRRIAGYIFGDNTVAEPIAMTTPVTSEQASAPIAMTTPVVSEASELNSTIVSFVMPSKYTLETIPKPNNSQVELVTKPARTLVVFRFSGWATVKQVALQTELFKKALQDAGIEFSGEPALAQYNPPWTPPFMRRNELWVEVKL